MTGLLQPDKEFGEKAAKYRRADGLMAVVLFGLICVLYALIAVLESKYTVVKENSMLFGGGLNILMVAITVLFMKMKKERISSIGLLDGKWRQSCLIGLVLAAVLFFTNCLSHIMGGADFITAQNIFKFVGYYLTVALCEEIVFRGYIGTRLYGIITNQYLVLLVSGILFVVMHFPYRMIAYGMTISDLTINNLGWIIDLFVTHIVLSFIYLKTNSLYGSVIAHWMSNLAYNLVAR